MEFWGTISSRHGRIIVGLALALVLAGVYAWQFGMQTADALLVRYKFRNLGDVSYRPRPLTDLRLADTSHKTVQCSGYEYELPWDDIDVIHSKTVGMICVTAFHSGNAFWFSAFPPRDFVTGLQREWKMSPDAFRRAFGAEAFDSDYAFMERMLDVRPSEITPIASPAVTNFDMSLLFIKGMAMPPADSGVYSVEVHNFRGFQFENLKSPRFQIEDDLYSNEGGINAIFLAKDRQTALTVTQPQVNRILYSIHGIQSSPVSRQTSASTGSR